MAPTTQILNLKRTRHDSSTEDDKENQPLNKLPTLASGNNPPIFNSHVICPPRNIVHPFGQKQSEESVIINTTRIIPGSRQVDPSDNPDPRIFVTNYGNRNSGGKLKVLKYGGPTSITTSHLILKTEKNTQFIYPTNWFKYRPSNPESPEENFESPNPYDVNDDGRKEYSVLKDPEFSFGEYLEMQRMMNQFVHRKFSGSDEMLKKCEKTYDAFKDFWKTSGLRGHFVLFDNPNPTKI